MGKQINNWNILNDKLPIQPNNPLKRKATKELLLNDEKIKDYKLEILKQPEEQHRARYLSEGSRGAIKVFFKLAWQEGKTNFRNAKWVGLKKFPKISCKNKFVFLIHKS